MPCSDGGPIETEVMKPKLDKVTRLLCEACELGFGNYSFAEDSSNALQEWWTLHQEEDRLRIKEENAKKKMSQIRRKALQKLSQEEINCLGLMRSKGDA